MIMKNSILLVFVAAILALSCESKPKIKANAIKPVLSTEPVRFDTDDPAIWIHPEDVTKSLVVGTDKNEDGGLFVFDMKGKILPEKTISGLKRPNNVDLLQNVVLGQDTVDIVVTGERLTHQMRVFTFPDMKAIDNGGIPMFEGETKAEHRDLMGVALYHRKADGKVFVIMGRKIGPSGEYLWQYELKSNGNGSVSAELVRKFGAFSQLKEIEAIAVDANLGYIYYSDENAGVRKYYADPEKGNEELAFFGQNDFADDHEGISIYQSSDSTGFVIVSDQQANAFNIYRREGDVKNQHKHTLLKKVYVSTMESDGSEVTSVPMGTDFPKGLFVAMSDDKTFQYYRIEDLLGDLLD